MLAKIGIYLAVFAGVFYLVKLIFPVLQSTYRHWQKKRMENITPKLDHMFLDIPLAKLMMIDVLSPLLSGGIGFAITKSYWIAAGCAAGGLFLPIVIIKMLEAQRRKKFSGQIVDGLLILSSSLKAGLSLLQAIGELVEEMPSPISQEFGLVLRQMQMGIALDEAMINLKKRMRVDELDLIVTALLVARETGGDLTITFSKVINTIQERNKLLGRVKALCVQGRMQGIIMSILPIGFGMFVYKTNPGFFDIFLKDPIGKGLMIYALFSEVMGIIFIRKFSKIDI